MIKMIKLSGKLFLKSASLGFLFKFVDFISHFIYEKILNLGDWVINFSYGLRYFIGDFLTVFIVAPFLVLIPIKSKIAKTLTVSFILTSLMSLRYILTGFGDALFNVIFYIIHYTIIYFLLVFIHSRELKG